jgi:hypothetical protein
LRGFSGWAFQLFCWGFYRQFSWISVALLFEKAPSCINKFQIKQQLAKLIKKSIIISLDQQLFTEKKKSQLVKISNHPLKNTRKSLLATKTPKPKRTLKKDSLQN